MHRVVVLVPNWLSPEGEASVLRGELPAIHRFAERGTLRKCVPSPAGGTPEAVCLGVDPFAIGMNDGPLIVSAFGYEPPARSVHFQLSLLSIAEGVAAKANLKIPEEDLAAILVATEKLNTKTLTVVRGEDAEHGLVWEDGSIELGTTPVSEMDGKPIAGNLPEGDGERILRRFIDDSINLLSDLELNQVRVDKGLEPLNLWWPWGQGFRTATPNLALRRGEICMVESSSIRLQGLARLCGYRHGERTSLRAGLRTDLSYLFSSLSKHPVAVAVVDVFDELRAYNRMEEAEWFGKELDSRLFAKLLDLALKESLQLTLLATSVAGLGLVLDFSSGAPADNRFPFDERALEEKSLQSVLDWQAVNEALAF